MRYRESELVRFESTTLHLGTSFCQDWLPPAGDWLAQNAAALGKPACHASLVAALGLIHDLLGPC